MATDPATAPDPLSTGPAVEPISYPVNRVARPRATPYRARLDAFVDAFIGLGVAVRASGFKAAQIAGWRGSPAAVYRRAERLLRRPAVQRLIVARLEQIKAESRILSAGEVLSEISHVARRRGALVDERWHVTNAKVKALELLSKHYGLTSESIVVREMPKDPQGAAHVVAHELARLGIGADGSMVYGVAPVAEPAAVAPADAPTTCSDPSAVRPVAPGGVYAAAAQRVQAADPSATLPESPLPPTIPAAPALELPREPARKRRGRPPKRHT